MEASRINDTLVEVEACVGEELTCPLCESHRVEELVSSFKCEQCGTSWRVSNLMD